MPLKAIAGVAEWTAVGKRIGLATIRILLIRGGIARFRHFPVGACYAAMFAPLPSAGYAGFGPGTKEPVSLSGWNGDTRESKGDFWWDTVRDGTVIFGEAAELQRVTRTRGFGNDDDHDSDFLLDTYLPVGYSGEVVTTSTFVHRSIMSAECERCSGDTITGIFQVVRVFTDTTVGVDFSPSKNNPTCPGCSVTMSGGQVVTTVRLLAVDDVRPAVRTSCHLLRRGSRWRGGEAGSERLGCVCRFDSRRGLW